MKPKVEEKKEELKKEEGKAQPALKVEGSTELKDAPKAEPKVAPKAEPKVVPKADPIVESMKAEVKKDEPKKNDNEKS